MIIHLIDDSRESREIFQDVFESISMETNSLEEINSDLASQLKVFSKDDFIISDFKLRNHSGIYSRVNGDIIIAEAYKKHIPGILCSSFVNSDLEISRVIRRYIPKIMRTQSLSQELFSQDYILKTKEIICNEFKDKYTKQRRPWRALLRTAGYDNDHKIVYVEIPSWEPDTKISIPLSDFPTSLKTKVLYEDFRFHAIVNLDCENADEIYIDEFEDK